MSAGGLFPLVQHLLWNVHQVVRAVLEYLVQVPSSAVIHQAGLTLPFRTDTASRLMVPVSAWIVVRLKSRC